MSNIQGYLQKILQAVYGKDVRQSIHDAIEMIDSVADTAKDSAKASAKMAETMAENAGKYADEAQTCVVAAAASEANAKASETAVKASENAAKTSADNAAASETVVANSKDAAAASEANAKTSEEAAGRSAEVATEKAAAADQSADTAAEKAEIATEKAAEIVGKAEAVAASATKAESYAVGGTGSREGEDTDNAAYYYRQAKSISESFAGALRPIGTVAFASLPALTTATSGDMYNISDEFTTTADFKEGAGNVVPAGANVYKTSDGKWDVLAGTPVTGVKGAKEASYRRGNVNITAANIGLGNVDNTADADKSVAHSSSSDLAKFTGYTDNVCNQLTTRTYKGTARDNGFMYMQADLDNQAVIVGINGLGETGVAYAKSANSANAAHCMRTYAANGTSHVDNFKLLCRHNTNGDNRFFLQIEGGTHEVSVAHAKYANSAGTATDATKMPIAGGTFTGAVGFANSTWNPVGDDCYMGDFNVGGCVAFKSMSSQLTGIALVGAGSNMYGRLLVQNDGGDMYLATNGAFYVSNGNNSARAPIYASAFTQSSSRRVKKNVEDMTDEEAKKLLDVEVKSYDYINPDMPDGCFGCIAEDMAKLIPSCVNGDVDCADDDAAAIQGIGIDYSKLVPHLIKMVQIQQAQIDAQQEQINKLA